MKRGEGKLSLSQEVVPRTKERRMTVLLEYIIKMLRCFCFFNEPFVAVGFSLTARRLLAMAMLDDYCVFINPGISSRTVGVGAT